MIVDLSFTSVYRIWKNGSWYWKKKYGQRLFYFSTDLRISRKSLKNDLIFFNDALSLIKNISWSFRKRPFFFFENLFSWISSFLLEMISSFRYDLNLNHKSVIVWSHLIFNWRSRGWTSVLVRIINMSIELLSKLSEIHFLLITKSSINFLIRTLLILQRENQLEFIADDLFLDDHILLDDELVTDAVRLSVLSASIIFKSWPR